MYKFTIFIFVTLFVLGCNEESVTTPEVNQWNANIELIAHGYNGAQLKLNGPIDQAEIDRIENVEFQYKLKDAPSFTTAYFDTVRYTFLESNDWEYFFIADSLHENKTYTLRAKVNYKNGDEKNSNTVDFLMSEMPGERLEYINFENELSKPNNSSGYGEVVKLNNTIYSFFASIKPNETGFINVLSYNTLTGEKSNFVLKPENTTVIFDDVQSVFSSLSSVYMVDNANESICKINFANNTYNKIANTIALSPNSYYKYISGDTITVLDRNDDTSIRKRLYKYTTEEIISDEIIRNDDFDPFSASNICFDGVNYWAFTGSFEEIFTPKFFKLSNDFQTVEVYASPVFSPRDIKFVNGNYWVIEEDFRKITEQVNLVKIAF